MAKNRSQPNILRVADLPQNSPTTFELAPGTAALSDLAEALGITALRKLRFTGTISALGRSDWELRGHLGATVVQPCVVTLDPVTTRIEADVERRFLRDMDDPDDAGDEIEMPEDENAEQLGAEIDLGAVMRESLALNLPLYPRAEGAELETRVFTEPGKKAMTDEEARPFAGLAGLRDKLGGEGEK